MNEEIKGLLSWETRGIEKVEKSANVLDRTTTSTGKLASVQAIGGEKMARYATSAGLLTGQMQQLGIQNELVARGFQVGTEAMTGMLGPIGLAITAGGLLATIIATLATEQSRYNQALLSGGTDALSRYANELGAVGDAARSALSAVRELKADRASDIRKEISRIDANIADATRPAFGSGSLDLMFSALGGGFQAFASQNASSVLRAANAQRKKLLEELAAMEGAAQFVGPPAPGAAGGGSSGGARGTGEDYLAGLLGMRGRHGAPVGGVRGGDGAGLGPLFNPAEVSDPWIESQDAMAASSERMAQRVAVAYSGLQSAAIGSQTAIATVLTGLLSKEGVARMKGLAIAKYVFGETAAAGLRGIADYAKGKTMEAAALLAEAVANPLYSGLIPARIANLGKWALIGGVAGGAAAAISAGSAKQFERDTRAADQIGSVGSGGGGVYDRSPGTSITAAAAGPMTINQYYSVTYQGSVIYGSGGTRDWFYRELAPLMDDYMRARAA